MFRRRTLTLILTPTRSRSRMALPDSSWPWVQRCLPEELHLGVGRESNCRNRKKRESADGSSAPGSCQPLRHPRRCCQDATETVVAVRDTAAEGPGGCACYQWGACFRWHWGEVAGRGWLGRGGWRRRRGQGRGRQRRRPPGGWNGNTNC